MDITQSNAMSIILKEQTRTLANEHFTITPNDYIKALHGQFRIGNNGNNGNDSDSDSDDDDDKVKVDWSAIGQRFAPWFLSVPRIQFMNGPLQASIQSESKPIKTRQTLKKRTFTSDAQLIQPKKVKFCHMTHFRITKCVFFGVYIGSEAKKEGQNGNEIKNHSFEESIESEGRSGNQSLCVFDQSRFVQSDRGEFLRYLVYDQRGTGADDRG